MLHFGANDTDAPLEIPNMRLSVSVTDVLRNFSDYVNRGERFVLVRGGCPSRSSLPSPGGAGSGTFRGSWPTCRGWARWRLGPLRKTSIGRAPSWAGGGAGLRIGDHGERASARGASRRQGGYTGARRSIFVEAILDRLTLVTGNVREFGRVPGLRVEGRGGGNRGRGPRAPCPCCQGRRRGLSGPGRGWWCSGRVGASVARLAPPAPSYPPISSRNSEPGSTPLTQRWSRARVQATYRRWRSVS